MDDQINKLILKNNFPKVKKNETIHSMSNIIFHKNPIDSTNNKQSSQKKNSTNINFHNFSSKNELYFQSFIKQYRNSNFGMTQNPKRFPKTPKNFLFKKGNRASLNIKRARTLQTAKHANSINESFEKSEILVAYKLDMELININISLLSAYFKAIYQDQQSIKRFNDKYKGVEGYEEILLLMHEFKDFNIFDYLNMQNTNTILLTKEQKEERQKNIAKRNNIILSLLIEHENLKEKEEKGLIKYNNTLNTMFDNNLYLFPLLENFKLVLSKITNNEISYEVELLIFCLLDYYDYAQFIYNYHIVYFKDLLIKIGIKDYDINKFIKIISNQEYDNFKTEEILFFRKSLNSMAERDFYLGINRIISNDILSGLANEGRLWKSIGTYMEPYDSYHLWDIYKNKINMANNFNYIKTIDMEYKSKIKEVEDQLKEYEKNPSLKKEKQEEFRKLNFDLDNLNNDIELPSVYDLETLILIFFKYLLKDTVLFFLDNIKELDEKIFEMCLAFDEDICIYIMDKCIKNSNVKASYMHLAIYKKFFKLTRMLIKYKICKNELIVFHSNIVPHGKLNKKNKNLEKYFYQESKEGVLHFLNEKDIINNNNLGETMLSLRNTVNNNIKSSINPENLKVSKTIITPLEKVTKFFKHLINKKRIKKRNSIPSPNLHTVKKTEKSKLQVLNLKNKIKFNSDIQPPDDKFNEQKNSSSSNLQSSNYSLIIDKREKKDSFFSMLNTNNNKNNNIKEKIFYPNRVLIADTNNTNNNMNSNNSIFRPKQNNIALEEDISPIRGKSHFIGKFSKFSVMKGNGNGNDNSNVNIQKVGNTKLKDIKNKTLRPKKWRESMSIDIRTIKKRQKSLIENNANIIKKMKKKIYNIINSNLNINNISNNNDENNNDISNFDDNDSPILKIIYNTDGEDADGSQLVIKNKTILGLNKTLNERKSKNINLNETDKENFSSLIFKSEKNTINNNNSKNNNQENKTDEDNNINDSNFLAIKKNVKFNDRRKSKKINTSSTRKDNNYYDPMFQSILNGNLKLNIQLILIENLRFGPYLFDAISLLGLMPLQEFSLELFEKICQNLNSYNTNEDSIITCPHPLISLALSAELLVNLGKTSKKIKFKSDSVCKSLLLLSFSIQTAIKNEDTLNFFLRVQTDIIGRSALEIYAENHFYDMLEDPNVGMIIGKLWYGAEHEHKLTTFLRMTRILRANSYELYEHLIRKDYLPKYSRFTFQFCQYLLNCSERNFYESVSIMGITLMYQAVVYLYVTFTKENELHPKSHYYYDVQVFTNILMLLNLLNDLLVIHFFKLTGRVGARTNVMKVFVNFLLFIFLFINMFDIPELLFPVKDNPDFNILLDGIVYSVILLMSWMKVLLSLRITKLYGSFISIMLNIFWHVVNFFIIFICITLLFAQCFCLFFRESNDNYLLIYDSFLTLFNSAWGQVDFNFVDLDVFGEVCLILFTTLSNIMLFNLIVGIVNNLFDQYHEKAEAESRAKLVLAHERKRWDKNYGLLILFPSPFNIFTIIFYPILIFAGENQEKLNLLFSRFCYFFVALTIFIYMFILGVLSYFLTLFISLYYSTRETIISTNKSISQNKCKIIFLSFLKRPVELIIYFVEDLISFWQVVFEEPKIDQEKKKREITSFRRYVITLRKILTDYKYIEHQTKLSVKTIRKKFHDIKKKSMGHLIREETSREPANTQILEEEKNWQKMINHTLFLQLNGQKKKKGQDYADSVSLTDGYSDNKSIQITYNKMKVKKKQKKEKDNHYKKSDNYFISSNKIRVRPNISNINIINNNNSNNNAINSENEDSRNVVNTSKDNTVVLQKRLGSIEKAKMHMSLHLIKNLWKIIDKFVDPEGIIDIDKTLNLLPDRAIYDNDYIQNLNYFNIRTIIRGIRKYYFTIEMDNSLFNFNKGNLMIYKLMTKIAMINQNLPTIVLHNLKNEFENLNEMSKFAKTPEAFQKYEEKDIMSDYDDEGKYAENNFYDKDNIIDIGSMIDTNRNGSERDGGDFPEDNKSIESLDENGN